MSTIPDPVASALFPKARREILSLLFGQTERRFYLREIVVRTGLGVGHVQRELERLAQAGILRRWREGRHVWFQADPACAAFEELHALVRKTLGAFDVLRRLLEEHVERIRVAFVYGSVARGEERVGSDLDLLVIGDVTLRDLVRALRPAEERIGREIHPTVFTPAEARARSTEHFFESVRRHPRVYVVGDDHELERVLA